MGDRLCMSCKPCSNQLEMDDDRCSEIYEEYWKDRLPTDPINITEICTLYYNKGRADTLKMYLLKDCESCKANMISQICAEVIDEVLAVLEAVPKECDCEYDLAEKVSKSKVLEAIKKLKEQL